MRDGRRRVEWWVGCVCGAGRGGAGQYYDVLWTRGEHARAPDAQAQAVHEACDITRESRVVRARSMHIVLCIRDYERSTLRSLRVVLYS